MLRPGSVLKSDIDKARVGQADTIPTLVDLALKYGTISRDQYTQLLKPFTGDEDQIDIEARLLDEGITTPYQLGLLKLIQEYHIVRKSGVEFGKIAIEKGFASLLDINHALESQKKEFRRSRHQKLIGDILVENRILTTTQKDLILKEQNLFNRYDDDPSYIERRLPEDPGVGRADEGEQQSGINIVVSSDHMTAWIERKDADKTAMTLNQVKHAAVTNGIVNGLYPDSLIQCFLDTGVKKFPVARVDCSDLLKRTSNLSLYIHGNNGKPIEKKKGDVLLEQTGVAREFLVENLYGEYIHAVAKNHFAVRCGPNTRWSRDKLRILAVKSGTPALSAARRVAIHPKIHVLEDADYRYGPIEPYADLSVSGTITGAYPITAGKVRADEIRGAKIDAIGNIHTRVGITGATIRAQGDVHARYVHNSKIETFGDVYIQNEIIDSQIRCSGKLESPKCRVIASKIYAKGGVLISGLGSERSVPSTIVAGGEQHAVGLIKPILDKINAIFRELENLKDEAYHHRSQAQKNFKKMIQLKTFHDKAKRKKDELLLELNQKKKNINEKDLVNIQKLLATYDKRMNSSLVTLKTMNVSKKEHDACAAELKKQISIFSVQAEKEILSHEKTLFAYLEKAKETTGLPVIKIRGKAYAGTMLGGVYQILPLKDDKISFKIEEVWRKEGAPEIKFTPPLHQL